VESRTWLPEQQFNPLLPVLPIALLGSVVLFDFGALISGVDFFGTVARWDLAAGLVVGLVVLTFLLIDLTTAPIGTASRRVLGVVSAATSVMVVLFTMVWWIRTDGDPAANPGLFLLEIMGLAAGVAGGWHARGLGIPPGGTERAPVWAPATLRQAPSVLLRDWDVRGPDRLAQAGAAASVGAPGDARVAPPARAAQASSSATLRARPSRPS